MMYKSNINNLLIESDFEIRPIRENEIDLDHFIEIDNRVLNIYLENDFYPLSKLQLTKTYAILIRQSKAGNKLASLHFLKNPDLADAYLNFDFDYNEYYLEIKNKDFSVDLFINRRKDDRFW